MGRGNNTFKDGTLANSRTGTLNSYFCLSRHSRGMQPRNGAKLLTMRRKTRFASIGILVVVSVVVMLLGLMRENASQRITSGSSPCPQDKELRTYPQWRQAVTFPYAAPEAKLRRVTDNYSLVEVGSSKEEVLKAFGPPDFEEGLAPKELNRPCTGYSFTYYFEKPEETMNEIKDKRIEVLFTRDGKVFWIAGNVGLVEEGGYAHRP